MRKLLLSVFVILTLFTLSCSRTNEGVYEGTGIIGIWILKEHYMDPGNGSGVWEPAPNHVFVEFKADSTLVTDTYMLDGYTRYEILNDSTIRFFQTGNTVTMRYELESGKLTIMPPCFEGCGMRFTRTGY